MLVSARHKGKVRSSSFLVVEIESTNHGWTLTEGDPLESPRTASDFGTDLDKYFGGNAPPILASSEGVSENSLGRDAGEPVEHGFEFVVVVSFLLATREDEHNQLDSLFSLDVVFDCTQPSVFAI